MRSALLLLVPLVACTETTVTVGGDDFVATGVFSDKLPHATLEIELSPESDAHQCSWDGRGSLEISLLVDERTQPHVLPSLRVASIPGSVVFDDGDQPIGAVSGLVFPTKTTWGVRAGSTTLDRIVAVEGTIDVVLADGRPMKGSFSAAVCDE